MVAVKKLNCIIDDVTLQPIRREIAILQKVSRDGNVVQFYGACLSGEPMLCMEYMEVWPLNR